MTSPVVPLLCPRCNSLAIRSFRSGETALKCQECGATFEPSQAKVYKPRSVWLMNPEIR